MLIRSRRWSRTTARAMQGAGEGRALVRLAQAGEQCDQS